MFSCVKERINSCIVPYRPVYQPVMINKTWQQLIILLLFQEKNIMGGE